MSKHTPGPWSFDPRDDPDNVVYSGAGNSLLRVTTVARSTDSDEEDVANGHLIAAAPHLLAACREAVVVLCENGKGDHPVVSRLNHAIAKAKGEP